jgi:hypothetical protein
MLKFGIRASTAITLCVITCGLVGGARAEGAAVEITAVVQNDTISGTTTNAPTGSCVVVYIKTDIWYIHPFADAGEGQSFAMVDGGSWSLPTVLRAPTANRIAVVLLPSQNACEHAPSRLNALAKGTIKNAIAFQMYDLSKAPSNTWKGLV